MPGRQAPRDTPRPSIHEQVAEIVELSGTYALDGAFYTAARKLREAADLYDRHADWCGGAKPPQAQPPKGD